MKFKNKIIKITFNLRNFLLLSITFVIFTVVGTITHEYGHIAVAKLLGYNTKLHYGSMHCDNPDLEDQYKKLYQKYDDEIMNSEDFPEKEEYYRIKKKRTNDRLFILLGGPLQTMFTGTIGLFFLILRQRKSQNFKITDWLLAFISLFWLREFYNLFMSVIHKMINPSISLFGGDEKKISQFFNIYDGTVPIIFGVTGLMITLFVIFKLIPERYRFTFILSGLTGGISGYILWFYFVGPALLP